MLWKFFRGNCHKFRKMISPYIDGRITPAEKQALESHLASCQGCRQELKSLQATVGFLHRVSLETVPRAFTVIEAKPVTAPTVLVPLRWATAVAVLALAVLFAGDLFHIYPEKSSPSSETPIMAVNPTLQSQETASPTPTSDYLSKLGASQQGGDKALEVTPTPAISGSQSPEAIVPAPRPGVAPVTPAVPTPASGEAVGNTTAIAEKGYRWPVRQMEFAVLSVAVVMLAATITVWRRRAPATIEERDDRQ